MENEENRGGGILFLVLLTMCVSFVACGGVTYTMSAESVSIEMGQTSSALKVYETDSEGAMTVVSDLAWSSSDNTVATVDETTGVVTGVTSGTVTITATGSTGSGSYELTVLAQVTYTAESTAGTLTAGETATVRMQANGSAVTTDVTYNSSSASVATVSSSGVVTGVGVGTATITMTRYGNTVTCTVKVAEDRELSITEIITGIGDETTLSLTEGGTEVTSGITWSTSDSSVATVTDGVVTGVGVGSAIITATYDGTTRTCAVIGATYLVTHSQDTFTSMSAASEITGNTFYTAKTAQMTDGVFEIINSSSTAFGSTVYYVPATADGNLLSGETATICFTITNNTDSSMTYNARKNGDTYTTKTLDVGASEEVSVTATYTEDDELALGYTPTGVGNITYSNMYVSVV